jgi:hypothetical protein
MGFKRLESAVSKHRGYQGDSVSEVMHMAAEMAKRAELVSADYKKVSLIVGNQGAAGPYRTKDSTALNK